MGKFVAFFTLLDIGFIYLITWLYHVTPMFGNQWWFGPTIIIACIATFISFATTIGFIEFWAKS